MKVGVAAAFRAAKSEDGAVLKTIPASEMRRDVPEGHPLYNSTYPIVGYMAFWADGVMKRPFWRFITYRAPVIYSQEEYAQGKAGKDTPARIGTATVSDIHCSHCGSSSPFPLGKGETRCPFCGKKGLLESTIIKEGSPRFLQMLAELQQPLEQAAKNAIGGDTPFAFPRVLLCARDLDPTAGVSPDLQEAAQSMGFGLEPLEEVPLAEFKEMGSMEPSLHLLPEITSGVLDSEEIKAGKGWTAGSVNWFVKANITVQKPYRIEFKQIRF